MKFVQKWFWPLMFGMMAGGGLGIPAWVIINQQWQSLPIAMIFAFVGSVGLWIAIEALQEGTSRHLVELVFDARDHEWCVRVNDKITLSDLAALASTDPLIYEAGDAAWRLNTTF